MKTRLLKKVRKRFSLVYHPNGYIDSQGKLYKYPHVEFIDSNNEFTYHYEINEFNSMVSRKREFRIFVLIKIHYD